MGQQKTLAYDSAKKRKILLATLIPLGGLVVATAIVVPVVLTQCKPNRDSYDLKTTQSKFTINEIETGIHVDVTNRKESWDGIIAIEAAAKIITIQDFLNASRLGNILLNGLNEAWRKNSKASLAINDSDNNNAVITTGEKIMYGFGFTEEQYLDLMDNFDNHNNSHVILGDSVKFTFTVINN